MPKRMIATSSAVIGLDPTQQIYVIVADRALFDALPAPVGEHSEGIPNLLEKKGRWNDCEIIFQFVETPPL